MCSVLHLQRITLWIKILRFQRVPQAYCPEIFVCFLSESQQAPVIGLWVPKSLKNPGDDCISILRVFGKVRQPMLQKWSPGFGHLIHTMSCKRSVKKRWRNPSENAWGVHTVREWHYNRLILRHEMISGKGWLRILWFLKLKHTMNGKLGIYM